MAVYSNSKLSTFEQCRQKYKFQYIDKIRIPGESIEAFLGSRVHEALEKLSQRDKVKADLVKLRYFAGLTGEQAAKVLGISHVTAERYWDYARSWLRLEIMGRDQTAAY